MSRKRCKPGISSGKFLMEMSHVHIIVIIEIVEEDRLTRYLKGGYAENTKLMTIPRSTRRNKLSKTVS